MAKKKASSEPRLMQTEVVPVSQDVRRSPALKRRLAIRLMSMEAFIERHGSGTLRKNRRIGFAVRNQYLEERTAYEFGWEFEILASTRVTFNVPISEQDQHAVTEAGWHIERYLEMSTFPEDYFEAKYIHVEYPDGSRREGIGLIVRQTSASFVPKGHIVFAIIAEYNARKKRWKKAKNPF